MKKPDGNSCQKFKSHVRIFVVMFTYSASKVFELFTTDQTREVVNSSRNDHIRIIDEGYL